MISRRALLRSAAAAAAAAGGAGLYTWQVEPHWLEIVERPLPIRGLPAALAGGTLAHLSDLHVGPRVSERYLLEVFRRVVERQPDIVAYTGDFTSFEPGIAETAARVYRTAPRGRFGTVGILGNHDYGPQWAHPELALDLVQRLAGVGITVLRNEVADLAGLHVVGLDDLWARQFDPTRAFAGHDQNRPTLVLSHNPDTVDHDGWAGYQGWVLAGHTHGGQCKPPFLDPPILPVANRRYSAGVIDGPGGRRLYISRGIGHLIQVRFNVRPEVTIFRLTGDPA